MSDKTDITYEELQQLPLNALVAFAARCARRVQPLYRLPEDVPDRLKHIVAVEIAITLAEQSGNGVHDSVAADEDTLEKVGVPGAAVFTPTVLDSGESP